MSEEISRRSRESRFQKISFLLVLSVISLGFLYMLRPFLMTFLMATVFAGLSHPFYAMILRRVKKPALASLLTLLAFVMVILLPVSLMVTLAYHEAMSFIESPDFAALPGRLEALIRYIHDHLPSIFSRWGGIRDPKQGVQEAFAWTLKHGANWSMMAASTLLNIALMLFIMFYLYIDGKSILRKFIHWSPLRDDYEAALIRNFLAVSRATLKGVLVVGVVQGTIGALLFWIIGLRSPVLLGILMIFTSILPMGSSVVWGPVAIYLFTQGRIGAAIAVLVVGGGVISTIDNVLRAVLVGKDIKMHDLMVLLSTLGGLTLFGLPGFVIGPIIASLFQSIWTMYEEVFAAELAKNRVPPSAE